MNIRLFFYLFFFLVLQYYEATLTIRGIIHIALDMKTKLELVLTRLKPFRESCFGTWLDLRDKHKDPILVDLFFQT